MNVPVPTYRVIYDGKNITAEIKPYITDLTYVDKAEFESDEVTINLEDSSGVWRNAWYPQKGSKLKIEYGYTDKLVSAGVFEIDEITHAGPPDVLTIKAIATEISQTLRTEQSVGYESQTLRQIVEQVAKRNGLTVQGTINNILFGRVTQNRETDLAFLRRMSYDYGYVFSVRNKTLIFYNIISLEKQKSVFVIDRKDLKSWDISDKTSGTFSKATVKHQAPADKVTYFGEEQGDGTFKADSLNLRGRVENKQQADTKSIVALYRANSKQQEGTISLVGNPVCVAGNNFDLTGLGQLSGVYTVRQSTHSFDRSGGYKTSATIKKVGAVDASFKNTEADKATPDYEVYEE